MKKVSSDKDDVKVIVGGDRSLTPIVRRGVSTVEGMSGETHTHIRC